MQANRAKTIWKRLVQSYGSRVADSYGPDMPKIWADAIDDLSDEQITYGLRKVLRDTPVHPPTLGQFVAACVDMPIAQQASGPTIQAQLCAYATLHLHDKAGPKDGMTLLEFGRPWTYVYREWRDETRPKGMEKCAECIGLVIELEDGRRLGWSVAAMLADAEGHAKAVRSFKPGPKPTEEQRKNWAEAHRKYMDRMRASP